MITYWTLEYNGVEKTLADWGFSQDGISAQFSNMAVDTFRVELPVADVTADEIIPFEGHVVIRSGRRDLGGGTWDIGTIEFQGKRLLHMASGRPGSEAVAYEFGGPWYDIDTTPYQQEFLQYTGTPPALTVAYASDVFLFQKADLATLLATPQNTGQMITRILQYVLSVVPGGEAAPFQIGTIEPATNLNTYQARDLKCSEAILHCLRAHPDCVVQFDYATVPPTLNIQRRSSLTPKTVTFADGTKHESITLTPRYDLQPRSVVVRFKSPNQSDGQTVVQTTTQKYPTDGPDGGRGVIVQTVDLEGYKVTTVQGKLDCVAFTNDRTWWQTHFADLKTTRTRRFRIGAQTYTDPDLGQSITLAATTIKDKDGNDVSLSTYPNQLRDGASIASWMKLVDGTPVTGVKVTITAEISCVQYDVEASGDPETSTNGRLLSKFLRKQIEAHVTLTNGITGTYSTLSSVESGEAAPSGMAQSIYQALSLLQYQGSFAVVEEECATAVRPGDVLNISGGRSEWAAMKALVQQVAKDYGSGRTTITIGPAAHLSAGDLTQLFLINRRRTSWRNPSVQASGKSNNSDSNAELGDKAPHQNSLPGLKEPSKTTVSAPATTSGNKLMLQHDAEGGQIQMNEKNASGTVDTAKPQVTIKMSDLQYAD